MVTKKIHPSIPCDTVYALAWDNDYNGWSISSVMPVWHEVRQAGQQCIQCMICYTPSNKRIHINEKLK